MGNESVKYTVIGAGNGGKAMAAHLAVLGFNVALYNRTPEHIAGIKARGGIYLESNDPNGPRGFGELVIITSDIQEAVDYGDVLMVVVPAYAHKDIARKCAPFLRDEQYIILHPGRTFGALEFKKELRDAGSTSNVRVAEAQTLIYASRAEGPAQARIFRIKEAVPLAAIPAIDTQYILDIIKPAFPQFIDGIDVLHTGINNIGAVFHPAITLMNAGRIEDTNGDFQFYLNGVTPTVARIMEVLDRERVTVASAIGVRATTAIDWLRMAYNTKGENLYEAIHNQQGYRGIPAPPTLQHRYITEDVPMSLVPIATLGKRYGVSVRCMDSIIRLASIIHRTDYLQRGRTLERLGIERLSVNELLRYVTEGISV
ncbi:MAG TPA: NAD(P)-binding domain-containing protein [Anaerolineae bacterium]|nr:NAD(P)-binding domain-containing protein [Anaerolineae bacterium]